MLKGDRVKFSAEGLHVLFPPDQVGSRGPRRKPGEEWRGEMVGEGRSHYPPTVRVKWDHLKTVQSYAHYFIEKDV